MSLLSGIKFISRKDRLIASEEDSKKRQKESTYEKESAKKRKKSRSKDEDRQKSKKARKSKGNMSDCSSSDSDEEFDMNAFIEEERLRSMGATAPSGQFLQYRLIQQHIVTNFLHCILL